MSISTHLTREKHGQILLSTAIIKIHDRYNQTVLARAQKLQLPRKRINYNIIGVDQKISQSHFSVKTKIRGRSTAYEREFEFLTLRKITTDLPLQTINTQELNIPDYVQLADPSFARPAKIELLLGAECFYNILQSGNCKPKTSKLVFQETELGWIVVGSTSRSEDGSFVVELPLRKDNSSILGDTRKTALSRFLSVENRLNKDTKLKSNYIEFMEEYESLGT